MAVRYWADFNNEGKIMIGLPVNPAQLLTGAKFEWHFCTCLTK